MKLHRCLQQMGASCKRPHPANYRNDVAGECHFCVSGFTTLVQSLTCSTSPGFRSSIWWEPAVLHARHVTGLQKIEMCMTEREETCSPVGQCRMVLSKCEDVKVIVQRCHPSEGIWYYDYFSKSVKGCWACGKAVLSPCLYTTSTLLRLCALRKFVEVLHLSVLG